MPVKINAVSSGAATANSGTFWVHASDSSAVNQAATLRLEISTNKNFASPILSQSIATKAEDGLTAKLTINTLTPGVTYYYRFIDASSSAVSLDGVFKTAPTADSAAALKFAFSGCADGRYAPFPAVNWEANNPGYDFFIMNGDAAYPTDENLTSLGVLNVITDTPEVILSSARGKLLANLLPAVNAAGATTQSSLQSLYRSQGVYASYDNHETGDSYLEAGGAPLELLSDPKMNKREGTDDPQFYVNSNPSRSLHDSPNFKAVIKAWGDNMPIPQASLSFADPSNPAPVDPVLYNSQYWGKGALIINLDDRSYRDAKITDAKDNDVSVIDPKGADNPNRTILGKTQFDWLKNELKQAQAKQTTQQNPVWKFINISSPIDVVGAPGNTESPTINAEYAQGVVNAKSWWGNYRYERNELLKYIAENAITNVVFLASDDHEFRVNELTYDPTLTTGTTANVSLANMKVVPGAFSVVAGPLGATRADNFAATANNFSTSIRLDPRYGDPITYAGGFQELSTKLAENQLLSNVNPIGLEKQFPGLLSLNRNINLFTDATAATTTTYKANKDLPNPVDFWSPQTFNIAELSLSRQGDLTVAAKGITAYKPTNSSPTSANIPVPTSVPSSILDFTISGQKLSDFKLETTPLRRFYNSSSGDHVWTNNSAEIDKIIGASAPKSGYVEETYDKITLWNQSAALAANNNDFSKIYRLYNGAKSDHLYTSSLVEKDNATKNLGYVDEGVIGSACTVKASADAMGLSGIARFLNNRTNQHHFVLDESAEFTALAGNASYKNEGIVCWI